MIGFHAAEIVMFIKRYYPAGRIKRPRIVFATVAYIMRAREDKLQVSGSMESSIDPMVHFLFNVSGTVLIYPVEKIRNIPLNAARWIADKAVASRRFAVVFVFVFFYGLPAVFAFIDRLFQ